MTIVTIPNKPGRHHDEEVELTKTAACERKTSTPAAEQRKRDKRKATARAGPVMKHRAWPPSWLLRSMLAATIMEVAMITAIVLRWI